MILSLREICTYIKRPRVAFTGRPARCKLRMHSGLRDCVRRDLDTRGAPAVQSQAFLQLL